MSETVATADGTYGEIVHQFGLDEVTGKAFYQIMQRAEDERKVALFRIIQPGRLNFTLEDVMPSVQECDAKGVILVVTPEHVALGMDA